MPYKNKAVRRSHDSAHRVAIRTWQRAWREKNKERLQTYGRIYRETHREAIQASMERYRVEHHSALLAQGRSYRQTHREERNSKSLEYFYCHKEKMNAQSRHYVANHRVQLRAYSRWYAANHKESRALNERRRNALKLALPASFTLEQWKAIKAAYCSRCAYCGKKMERLTQDHVIPLSKRGGHTADNIVPACLGCNTSKRANLPTKIPPIRLMM